MKKISKISSVLILILIQVFLAAKPQSQNIIRKFLTWNFLAEQSLFDVRFILEFKDDLQLSFDQENQIENKMLKYEEYFISKCSEIKIQELNLASYLESEKIDRKKVEKLIRETSENKIKVSIDYLNYILEIKTILTLQQIEKLKKIKTQVTHMTGKRIKK